MSVVLKPSSPMLGLDIGSSQIKIVEARSTRDGIQITGMAVVQTPEELYQQGTIIDPKGLGLFIKKLLATHKLQGRKVVSAITGQSSVVVRIVDMAKMSDKELKDTMKWEVERHVPFAANDVEMDFVPIPNPSAAEDSQTMEVLLVVAQREAITQHLEVLEAAGLQPVAIDVAPLALGRALVSLDSAAEKHTVGILNIGSGATDMNIFRDGTLAFTRPIPIAGDLINRQVGEALRRTPEEAEEMIRTHGTVLLDASDSHRSMELDTTPEPAPAENPAPVEDSSISTSNNGLVDLSMPLGLLGGDIPIPDDDEDAAKRPSFDLSAEMESLPNQAFDLQAPIPASEPQESTPETPEANPESIFDLESIAPGGGLGGNLGNGPLVIGPREEEEAPKRLSLDGLTPSEQVYQALKPLLDELVTEIRRSLDYYRSRAGGEEIAKIILCGGISRLPNLDTYLARELNVIVDVASLGPRFQCTYQNFSANSVQEALPVIPVSLGLAIREMVDEEEAPKPQKAKAGKAS